MSVEVVAFALVGYAGARLVDRWVVYSQQRKHRVLVAFANYGIVARRFETIRSINRRCEERRREHDKMRAERKGIA